MTAGNPFERTPELRHALIEQLAFLIEEMDMARHVLVRVPDPMLAGHPLPGMPSVKDLYGAFAGADTGFYLPLFRKMAAGEQPVMAPAPEASPESGWDDRPILDVLAQVSAARTDLVAFLEALAPEGWMRTAMRENEPRDLYDIAYELTQQDAARLREIGSRLYSGAWASPL